MTGNKGQKSFLDVIQDSPTSMGSHRGSPGALRRHSDRHDPSRPFARLRAGSLSADPPAGIGKRQPRDPRG